MIMIKPSSLLYRINRHQLIIISPLIMVLTCHLVARFGSSLMSKWAFIPVILTLWLIALIFLKPLQHGTYKKWFGKNKGNAIWKGLVILVGILPLPVFLIHWQTL